MSLINLLLGIKEGKPIEFKDGGTQEDRDEFVRVIEETKRKIEARGTYVGPVPNCLLKKYS